MIPFIRMIGAQTGQGFCALLLAPSLLSLLPAGLFIAHAAPMPLFESGFETADEFSDWTSALAPWDVVTSGGAFSGTKSAMLEGATSTRDSYILRQEVSSVGYENLTLSFYYKQTGLEAGDVIRVEWYDGSSWHTVGTIAGATGSADDSVDWVFASYNLPESASDNSGLAFRFVAEIASSDIFRLDEVVLEGEPLVIEVPTTQVTGFKWNDADGDGSKDENEAGLAGWEITALNRESEETIATTTDATGAYVLEVPAGSWEITEAVVRGWEQVAVTYNGERIADEEQDEVGCLVSWNVEQLFKIDPVCDFYNRLLPEEPTATTTDGTPNETPDDEDSDEKDPGDGDDSQTTTGTRVTNRAPAGRVLGAATSTMSGTCGMYLDQYLRLGQATDQFEVSKLQLFLASQRIYTPLSSVGVFDAVTDRNVRAYQAMKPGEILVPWVTAGFMEAPLPTGYVYMTTRHTINNLVCPGSESLPTLR